jgi:hypothetical protein
LIEQQQGRNPAYPQTGRIMTKALSQNSLCAWRGPGENSKWLFLSPCGVQFHVSSKAGLISL